MVHVTGSGRAPADDRAGGAAREPHVRERPSLAAQWTGVLLAPATFFAHLQGAYVLVPRACLYHAEVWLHVVGVASVVLAAAGTWVAWRVWSVTGRHASTEPAEPVARARFLGLSGFAISALFVLLLIAQWVAAFFISPCQ
jgi:hypothetical protein